MGDRVATNYQGRGIRDGKIKDINSDDKTFKILYDDGTEEDNISMAMLKITYRLEIVCSILTF